MINQHWIKMWMKTSLVKFKIMFFFLNKTISVSLKVWLVPITKKKRKKKKEKKKKKITKKIFSWWISTGAHIEFYQFFFQFKHLIDFVSGDKFPFWYFCWEFVFNFYLCYQERVAHTLFSVSSFICFINSLTWNFTHPIDE